MNSRFMTGLYLLRTWALRITGFRVLTSLAILTALACPQHGEAQVSARIKGTVTDSSGAPVADSTVNAKNIETGATRSTTTDEAGRYLILSLPVGEYELKASKSGFQDATRTGIRLVVGQEASVDLTL